jgi:hypothetical protein
MADNIFFYVLYIVCCISVRTCVCKSKTYLIQVSNVFLNLFFYTNINSGLWDLIRHLNNGFRTCMEYIYISKQSVMLQKIFIVTDFFVSCKNHFDSIFFIKHTIIPR